eukprot:TRINITY_DN1388_c0_g1_i2.p1 TRINITY_DN1388_c0_g1~~TRINITY_DN1388_c0_g1_i2.p1  ORF type:complete len:252 (+),score=55.66 TRINITY_DN1388_c0_g1_i2:56-811(+)
MLRSLVGSEMCIRDRNKISWKKDELVANQTRFSEVPDSYFVLIEKPSFKQLKVTLKTQVSRAALGAVSLPLSIQITNPPAKRMKILLTTEKPNQPNYVKFLPEDLAFEPGQTEITFNYITSEGAVSGLIKLKVGEKFEKLYFVAQDTINFEILDVDKEPPAILNYYIADLGRTYMYFRISASETAVVYYLLSLRGTQLPKADEIKDVSLRLTRKTKTDVIEVTGSNSSNQTQVTKTFIYYDTYLHLSLIHI